MGSISGDVMDKITEELINSLIQRIEGLDQRIKKVEGKWQHFKKNTTRGPGQATTGQLSYIRGLEKDLNIEGEDYSMLSKQEAGDYIEKLLAEKNKNKSQQVKKGDSDGSNENHLETRIRPGADNKEEHMPESVDNQPAEISKPLTQEEIDEIGEEALL